MECLVWDHAWQKHWSFFFFAEKMVTATTYLDMLQLYAMPQLPDGTIYQQDGTSPQFPNIVNTVLDEHFPAIWIGRGSRYITRPARSPNLTPPDISSGSLLWSRCTEYQYVIWQTCRRKNLCRCQQCHITDASEYMGHRWISGGHFSCH